MELLTIENATNLAVLIFLQAVLGFDNLLYISIESKRAPAAQQAAVRRWGILIAVALRLVLLFVMIKLLQSLTQPLFSIDLAGVIEGTFNFATIVFLFGGGFIQGSPFEDLPISAALAAKTGATVICPHYRLAPEHPFPAGLDDVTTVAGVLWWYSVMTRMSPSFSMTVPLRSSVARELMVEIGGSAPLPRSRRGRGAIVVGGRGAPAAETSKSVAGWKRGSPASCGTC